MSQTVLKRFFWITGAVLFAVGLIGWYDRLAHGHLHTNYGTVMPWGIGVAFYVYFIGLSAGSFLISSLVYVFNVTRFERIGRLALFSALVTLLLSLLSIWPDIGHMHRVWHILAYPNFKSPMAVITWLYLIYLILLSLELWFLVRRDLVAGTAAPGLKGSLYRLLTFGSADMSEAAARRDRITVRILASIGIPLAIMFSGGVGTLFGVIAARPHWHSGMIPIHFLLVALVSGGAFLMAVAAIFHDGWRSNRDAILALGRIVLSLLLLDLLFQVSEMLVAFYGGIPGHIEGLNLMIGGSFWWVFWGGQMLLGSLIPVLLLTFPTRKRPGWVSLAGLLIAVGYLGVRLNIVIPGLSGEAIRGLSEAIASSRMATQYFPSVTEWLLIAWVIGLGLLLFGFGELLLPRDHGEESHVRV